MAWRCFGSPFATPSGPVALSASALILYGCWWGPLVAHLPALPPRFSAHPSQLIGQRLWYTIVCWGDWCAQRQFAAMRLLLPSASKLAPPVSARTPAGHGACCIWASGRHRYCWQPSQPNPTLGDRGGGRALGLQAQPAPQCRLVTPAMMFMRACMQHLPERSTPALDYGSPRQTCHRRDTIVHSAFFAHT